MQYSLTNEKKEFTDYFFEENYNQISAGFLKNEEINIDFQFFQWFDPWALIQLLILIEKHREKAITIFLADAMIIKLDERKRHRINNALCFLLDINFLSLVTDLGCQIKFRRDSINKFENTSVAKLSDQFFTDLQRFNIIPITKISDLNLKYQVDRLYHQRSDIFKKFFSEMIIQQADLGDCLLTELVSNVMQHTDKDGYVCLRIVGGLNDGSANYENGKFARLHHGLPDWRSYFQEKLTDGFFELTVVDQGEGISQTIPRAQNEQQTHDLIKFALEPFTSRYTKEQRIQNGWTEFTGLGATLNTIIKFDGCLLIRENQTRHIFFDNEKNNKDFIKFKNSHKKDIAFPKIIGTAVAALIPINGFATTSSPLKLKSSYCQYDGIKSNFYKVVTKSRGVKYDKLFDSKTWEEVETSLLEINDGTLILIDVNQANFQKNSLWTGLTKIKKLCDSKKCPLFLSGVTDRIARRLRQSAELGKYDLGSGVIIGFGDNDIFYSLGLADRANIEELRIAFNSTVPIPISDRLKNLLVESNYIRWQQFDEELDLVTLEPSLVANYSQLRSMLLKSLAEKVRTVVKNSKAWQENAYVRLINGDVVKDYLCIHSLSQIDGIYPLLSRITKIISHEFEFDFVMSVGTAAKHTIAKELCNYKNSTNSQSDFELIDSSNERKSNQTIYYSYQDYSSFDHGEITAPIIKSSSKVLIIVDGIRKRENCREAIEHVADCGAVVVAVITLVDLNGNLHGEVSDIPFRKILTIPILQLVDDEKCELIEEPYSHRLISPSQAKTDTWKVRFKPKLAYSLFETFGIFQRGHLIFLDHHFIRNFSLPYLFQSRNVLNHELITDIVEIIKKSKIDTILYPEYSSIGQLIEEILDSLPENIRPKVVVCRRAVFPGKRSSYSVNTIGKEILKGGFSKKVLILDDQIFTGETVRSIMELCFKLCPSLSFINVYIVVESMLRTSRKELEFLLFANNTQHNRKITFKLSAFVRFPMFSHWNQDTCPSCKSRADFRNLSESNNLFLESRYAQERLFELVPSLLDHETQSKKNLEPIPAPITLWCRFLEDSEPVVVRTIEAYEAFCETAYLEGELEWLIDRLLPSHNEHFPNDVIIFVIDLLVSDLPLLVRFKQRRLLIQNLKTLLNSGEFKAGQLSKLLETLSKFPLYCLKGDFWIELWNCVLSAEISDFIDSYPGASYFLQNVAKRSNEELRKDLLDRFSQLANQHISRSSSPTDHIQAQMVKCLQRSTKFDRILPFHALVYEIYELFHYPAGSSPNSHQVLFKGLLQLSSAKETEDPIDYAYVLQLLGFLKYYFQQLASQYNVYFVNVAMHPEYEKVLLLMDALFSEFPTRRPDVIQNIHKTWANSLVQYFFESSQFHVTLEGWLESYLSSFDEVVFPISSLGDGFIIQFDESRGDSKLIINAAAIKSIFGEVRENLLKLRERLNKQENYKEISVEIKYLDDVEYPTIQITNDAQATLTHDIENPRRSGFRQIRENMEKLGYRFEKQPVEKNGKFYLVQKFQIRKVFG